jgi:acylglycerol lipase
MAASEPLATYLELRESTPEGEEGSGLSHKAAGLVLLHVLELAAHGEPRGGVTLVHDAGDHGSRYLDTARILAEGSWAVALPDLRGHGRSEGERGHSAGIKEVLRDLQAVQDHLAYRLPDAPKALIGQGLGAIHALAFAVERPDQVAALALLAPRWKPGFDLPQPGGGLMKVFKKVGPTSPGRIGNDPALLTGLDSERHAWQGDGQVHDVITLRAGTQAIEAARVYGARIGELGMPVLVLHGAQDKLADPGDSKALQGKFKNVEVRLLDGLAHDLLHERGAQELAGTIRHWLEAAVARRHR